MGIIMKAETTMKKGIENERIEDRDKEGKCNEHILKALPKERSVEFSSQVILTSNSQKISFPSSFHI